MSFNNINYQKILKYINDSSKFYQNTAIPSIIAVTKTQPESVVLEALQAGIRSFGENRVQEALIKYKNIKANHQQVKLHMIGPLQTNKVKKASEIFDCIHSLDRENLAQEFVKNVNFTSLVNISFFIQVNTGKEKQKAGINFDEADGFIKYCLHDLKLNVIGLMCIPPHNDNPTPHFMILKKLAFQNQLQHLSMGMGNDYEIAIKNGATFIRIGSRLFGER